MLVMIDPQIMNDLAICFKHMINNLMFFFLVDVHQHIRCFCLAERLLE